MFTPRPNIYNTSSPKPNIYNTEIGVSVAVKKGRDSEKRKSKVEIMTSCQTLTSSNPPLSNPKLNDEI